MSTCPIVCPTCGTLIGDKWVDFFDQYRKFLNKTSHDNPDYLIPVNFQTPTDANMSFDKHFLTLGLERYCCRRIMIGHFYSTDFITSIH